MIPMFRVFSSGNVRGICVKCLELSWRPAPRRRSGGDAGQKRNVPTKKARTGLGATADSARTRLYRAALHGLDIRSDTALRCARATAEYSRVHGAPGQDE